MSWTEDQYAEISRLATARWPHQANAGAEYVWKHNAGALSAFPFERVRDALVYVAEQGESFPSTRRLHEVARTLPR